MMLLGIISDQRARHSLSPRMHGAVLQRHGLEGVYLPLAVAPDDLGPALAGLAALGFRGVNVTAPYKQAVIPWLAGLGDQARRAGAVNTIVIRDGRLEGRNTDVEGFARALAGAGDFGPGDRALVLGAGGAARAVVAALGGMGLRATTAARNLERARALAHDLGGEAAWLDDIPGLAPEADLLVNAASVSAPEEAPELAELAGGLRLGKCRLVVDVNYGRSRNIWADLARAHGLAFMDGLPMLAQQARLSFRLWTGIDAPAEEFAAPLEESP